MTGAKAVLLSVPVVAVALAALAVGFVELGRYWHLGEDALFLIVIPVALAVIYVSWYRTLPYEPRRSPSVTPTSLVPGATTDEPFEDPVEEADRLDQEVANPPPESEAPTIVEDDAVEEPSAGP
ncbi:MAG TPA: hypothetical protein VEG66_05010 [Thermoplasmata archaeon]|jgi:hypothetical protein|nr:hypothetical protein [Thermoplasmata archaeon]